MVNSRTADALAIRVVDLGLVSINAHRKTRYLPSCRISALAKRVQFVHKRKQDGQVAERFKAPVLKTGVRETVPWVRIPPCPPLRFCKRLIFTDFPRLLL